MEVTESALLANLDAALRVLHEVRALGVRVALDDFGVGYASLSHLRKLPVDTVKIDQSFTRDLDRDPEVAVLVGNVLDLVHGLGLSCVAEGIEQESHLAYLRTFRCEQAQGYLFARPQAAEQLSGSALQLSSPWRG